MLLVAPTYKQLPGCAHVGLIHPPLDERSQVSCPMERGGGLPAWYVGDSAGG